MALPVSFSIGNPGFLESLGGGLSFHPDVVTYADLILGNGGANLYTNGEISRLDAFVKSAAYDNAGRPDFWLLRSTQNMGYGLDIYSFYGVAGENSNEPVWHANGMLMGADYQYVQTPGFVRCDLNPVVSYSAAIATNFRTVVPRLIGNAGNPASLLTLYSADYTASASFATWDTVSGTAPSGFCNPSDWHTAYIGTTPTSVEGGFNGGGWNSVSRCGALRNSIDTLAAGRVRPIAGQAISPSPSKNTSPPLGVHPSLQHSMRQLNPRFSVTYHSNSANLTQPKP